MLERLDAGGDLRGVVLDRRHRPRRQHRRFLEPRAGDRRRLRPAQARRLRPRGQHLLELPRRHLRVDQRHQYVGAPRRRPGGTSDLRSAMSARPGGRDRAVHHRHRGTAHHRPDLRRRARRPDTQQYLRLGRRPRRPPRARGLPGDDLRRRLRVRRYQRLAGRTRMRPKEAKPGGLASLAQPLLSRDNRAARNHPWAQAFGYAKTAMRNRLFTEREPS